MKCTRIGLVAMTSNVLLTLAMGANAASNFSNSLAGFTGDSTQAGTQTAVGPAGLSFLAQLGLTITGFGAIQETIPTTP